MNKLVTYISALALCCSFAQCSDYLNTSSPENTGDEFVTSSTSVFITIEQPKLIRNIRV